MEIKLPEFSLVLLMGASGSGKSTFAKRFFQPYEIVSSDACRGMVSNDENNQNASRDAFALLNTIVETRLKNRLLTVVDATNVQENARKELLALSRKYHALPAAIVFHLPPKLCAARNALRSDRDISAHAVRRQADQLKRSIKTLRKEGFRSVTILHSEEEVNSVSGIHRELLYNDKRALKGPFDIVGDVHGCADELRRLLVMMGYQISSATDDEVHFGVKVTPPEGRTLVFVGDLVDRGPDVPGVLRIAMSMVNAGTALCVAGNHDDKLLRKLSGKEVQMRHGLAETMEQLSAEPDWFREKVRLFLDALISHYVLDSGKLVVAHAGIREDLQLRASGKVRSFCMYGETTGETDEYGLPVRYNWASEYKGNAVVVYGHTPVPEAEWLNRTIDIDTGCVFGGKLTALRYPEMELQEVIAEREYYTPSRPLHALTPAGGQSGQALADDVLDIADVTGRRTVQTRLRGHIQLREENSIAALEVMSRFAIHPKWLIYLPPTMSPTETSRKDDLLEHPAEGFRYFAELGIEQVVCEEKHMGSRAVLVVCRNAAAAQTRFGVTDGKSGVMYTRTGRTFFPDPSLEQDFVLRVSAALETSGFWEALKTDWVLLDCELMPWSAKAIQLLRDQYASVGAASESSMQAVQNLFQAASGRSLEGIAELSAHYADRFTLVQNFRRAYRNYCWPVQSMEDYKLAPFHILATEGEVHTDKNHLWHIEHIRSLCEADPGIFRFTSFRVLNPVDPHEIASAVQWWDELTAKGGEGMVIKPVDFISHKGPELVQPGMKCRGREYLRIIYGPEYSLPQNLKRLKTRSLAGKRSLALREFALGVEGLERFVRREPLRRVHECVFGVLALESEWVDPRL